MSAEVTIVDDGTVESRYIFGSRAEIAAYEAGPAQRLRADSALLFGPGTGVRTTRTLGTRAIRVPD